MAVRRGRPATLPVDGTPFDGPRVDVEARLAWLLRVHRLCSADPDNRSLAGFARRLRATGVACDSARISRWETGQAAVPEHVVARYERVLGVPAGALRSVVGGLRALAPEPRPAGPAEPAAGEPAQDRLDRVYDRLVVPGAVGGDWLDLADLLHGPGPERVLLPGALLEEWVGRLVAELMRAVGPAYTTRFQALTTLITYRPLTALVAGSIDTVVREPGAQGVADPVSLLGEVGTPLTTARLLRAFAHEDGGIRLGSALALLNLVVTGTVPASHHTALVGTLGQVAAADPDGPGAALARMVAARLPLTDQLAAGLPPADQVVAARTRPSTPGPPAAGAHADYDLRRRTGATALAAAAREHLGVEDDPMLDRLLLEALGSHHQERRHHAGLLLMASPYRPAVAALTAHTVAHGRHPSARQAAASLLRYVVGPAQTPLLHTWLTTPQPPDPHHPDLAALALGALAHAGDPTDPAGPTGPRDPTGPSGLDGSTGSADPGGAGDPRSAGTLATLAGRPGVAAPALVYAAGMTGSGALRGWADDPAAPPELRGSARWWLRNGPAIHDRT